MGSGTEKKKHFLATKERSDICKPKHAKGLGFHLFHDTNLSLLGKLGWKLAMGEQSLWTKVPAEKYLKNSFFSLV